MPEQLDTFEFRGGGQGNSRYDWDMLLDGSIYRLTQGADFDGKPGSVKASAQKQASKRGKNVRVQVEDNSVVLQAYTS